MLASISRALKPGGLFVSISFALPEQRTKILSGPLPQLRGLYRWSVFPQEMVSAGGMQFTMYVCRKKFHDPDDIDPLETLPDDE